jgi:hypothetical protein
MTTEQRKAGKRERVRELLEKLRASKPKPIDGEHELKKALGRVLIRR